jgi:hypothetical protein
MTITEIYQAFLAGSQLPALTSRTCRQLLDMARNAILTKGKEPKFTVSPGTATDEKQNLIAAGDQLRQLGIAAQGAIYAQAGTDPLAGKLDEIERRAAKLTAAGDASPFLNAYLESQGATPTRPAKAPAPAAKPAAKRDLIADVQREFAKAKELTKAEDARRTPTPRQATPPPTAARPAPRPAPIPARPAQPAKPEPSGLESTADNVLMSVASGKLGKAHIANATLELSRRGWKPSGKAWLKPA